MRVGILTTDDRTWALPTWTRTIPALRERHEVVGVFLVPDRLGSRVGRSIPVWYIRVFGVRAAVLFALYSLRARMRPQSGVSNWNALGKRHGFAVRRGPGANTEEARKWMHDAEVDILFVMVGEILRSETLAVPRIGAINKHAAVLPAARGVFPFFWSRLANVPTGISFHVVDDGIDTGSLLAQERLHESDDVSMLRFYIDSYSRYPHLAAIAADRLAASDFIPPPTDVEPSYFSFPSRTDVREFERRGHRVARLSDIWHAPVE